MGGFLPSRLTLYEHINSSHARLAVDYKLLDYRIPARLIKDISIDKLSELNERNGKITADGLIGATFLSFRNTIKLSQIKLN